MWNKSTARSSTTCPASQAAVAVPDTTADLIDQREPR
jgi:hypothetical protein